MYDMGPGIDATHLRGGTLPGTRLVFRQEDAVGLADNGFVPAKAGGGHCLIVPGDGGQFFFQFLKRTLGSDVGKIFVCRGRAAHASLELLKGGFVQTVECSFKDGRGDASCVVYRIGSAVYRYALREG